MDVADRAAPPAADPPDPCIGPNGRECGEEGEQQEEERFATTAVDVVAVAGNELKDVRHHEQGIRWVGGVLSSSYLRMLTARATTMIARSRLAADSTSISIFAQGG